MRQRIYLASSWRNDLQPKYVAALREAGHSVYDFRNPPGKTGFSWREIDANWKSWSNEAYLEALGHPISEEGFRSDFEGMKWANTGVLLLPCGRSAHIEAGYFVGAAKDLHIVLPPDPLEPELMYLMTSRERIHLNLGSLLAALDR